MWPILYWTIPKYSTIIEENSVIKTFILNFIMQNLIFNFIAFIYCNSNKILIFTFGLYYRWIHDANIFCNKMF